MLENKNRESQIEKLRSLFARALECGYSVIAIRIHPPITEYLRWKNKSLLKGRNVFVRSCARDKLPEFMEWIKTIHRWHISTIRFLIGTANLSEVMKQKYADLRISITALQKNTFMDGLECSIIGVLDPLDDDINVYGGMKLKEIIEYRD